MKVQSHERLGIHIFKISGTLCAHQTCYSFLDDVRSSISGGAGKMIVDLDGVEKLDSSGVGILASIINSADNAGVRLVFSGLSERTERPIVIVGLMKVMKIAPTLEDALLNLNAG